MISRLVTGILAGLLVSSAVLADDIPQDPVVKTRPGTKSGAESKRNAVSGAPAHDRLDLDTTAVTGSRELPKVLVILPWKRADMGDLVGKPLNSLVDEALQPVDREVFRREVDFHTALTPDHGPKTVAKDAPNR